MLTVLQHLGIEDRMLWYESNHQNLPQNMSHLDHHPVVLQPSDLVNLSFSQDTFATFYDLSYGAPALDRRRFEGMTDFTLDGPENFGYPILVRFTCNGVIVCECTMRNGHLVIPSVLWHTIMQTAKIVLWVTCQIPTYQKHFLPHITLSWKNVILNNTLRNVLSQAESRILLIDDFNIPIHHDAVLFPVKYAPCPGIYVQPKSSELFGTFIRDQGETENEIAPS